MKTYTTKSNARRAAKQAGLEQFDIVEIDDKFSFKEIVAEDKARKEKKPAKKGTRVVTDKSVAERPTKQVWHIADAMFERAEAAGEPQPKRKDVIQACVEAGIAFYTARTQYQQWWQCRNGKM